MAVLWLTMVVFVSAGVYFVSTWLLGEKKYRYVRRGKKS